MATVLGEALSPTDAIAYWKDKALMPDSDAKKLMGSAKSRAFYVTGLAELDQLKVVHGALLSALENGETLRDFKKNIAGVIAKQGWHKHRIGNIFQTNMQTAYSAGRYAQMQKVTRTRPYWQYASIMDRRTRPNHAVLHGMVYPFDHEFWDSHYPPNGFRCRCTVRTLSERQVGREKLQIQDKMPSILVYTDPKTGMETFVHAPKPDKGFSNNVGKDWLGGLSKVIIDKLEESPTQIAQNFVRKIVKNDFERWEKEPNFEFPIAVLSKEQSAKLGASSVVVRLSAETMDKQKEHHPELSTADYQKAQDAVAHGEMYEQNADNMAFVLEEANGAVCIVKATKDRDKLYMTSLWRLSKDEAERNRTIAKIRKPKNRR